MDDFPKQHFKTDMVKPLCQISNTDRPAQMQGGMGKSGKSVGQHAEQQWCKSHATKNTQGEMAT